MRLLIFLLFFNYSYSQDSSDLLSLMNSERDVTVINFFKDIKLINSHSVEFVETKVLHFIIQHRFGPLAAEGKNLWGLDESDIRFGLTYGLRDNLNIGFGRSSYDDVLDFFIKKKISEQNKIPFTSSFVGSIFFNQFNFTDKSSQDFILADQFSCSAQILIARKFNKKITLQIMPTIVCYNKIFYNVVGKPQNDYTNYSIGSGARFMLTKSTAINLEYYYQITGSYNNNNISIGFDIETGGHVFQFHFSNTNWMIEKGYINRMYVDRDKLFFGFNISRVFNFN